MSEHEIKMRFTGWKAIVVILAIVGFFGFKWFQMGTTIESEAVALVKFDLQSKYASAVFAGEEFKKAKRTGTAGSHRSVQKLLELDKIEENRRRRHQHLDAIKEKETQLDEAEARLTTALSERESWQAEWSQALQPLDRHQDTTPEEAREALDQIAEFRVQLDSLHRLEDRVRLLESEIHDYKSAVQRLAPFTELDLETTPHDVVVQDVVRQLDRAQTRHQKRKHLEEQRQEEKQRLDRTESRIRELTSLLESLCEEAGCESADELPEIERQAEEQRQLETDLQQRNERLLELGGGQSMDRLLQEAETEDPDTLDHRIRGISAQVTQLDNSKTELDREFGRQEKELETLSDTAHKATASELSGELHSVLAGLSDRVEQYTELVLARWVLRRAIERYRERNQGPVLRRARELFSRLTLGSFVDLLEDDDTAGEPVLRGIQGGGDRKIVPVEGMSEGTRDQLYLALRLASLEHYLDSHPPFPLIADALLANFDDSRSRATLEVLTELSRKTQVIFFTHHAHLIELAKDTVPGDVLRVHELGKGTRAKDKVPETLSG